MCDFRGDPDAIYLIEEGTIISLTGIGSWHPLHEDLMLKPPGMYHSYGVTGCGYYYSDGTRILKEYNGFYPRRKADYLPIYSGIANYWGYDGRAPRKLARKLYEDYGIFFGEVNKMFGFEQ